MKISENKQKTQNIIAGIPITRKMVRKFVRCLRKGRQNPRSSEKIAEILRKKRVFQEMPCEIDHNLVGQLATIALINWNVPIGSCSLGRFIINTEEDKNYTMDYLERNHYHKPRFRNAETGEMEYGSGYTKRYNVIRSIQFDENDKIISIDEEDPDNMTKKHEEIETDEKDVETEECSQNTLSEETCVSFDEKMDFIIIRPKQDKKPNPNVIDAYEISIDTLSNHADILNTAMYVGKKSWMNKEMILDFMRIALSKL